MLRQHVPSPSELRQQLFGLSAAISRDALKKDEGAILFLLEVAMYGDKLWIGNNGRRAIYAVGESMANTFLCK